MNRKKQMEKTFLFDLICDDLNEKIINIVETKRNKEKLNIVIKYIDHLSDEWDFEDNAETLLYFITDMNDLRFECEFLEYNNLWNTKYEENLIKYYGKERIDEFMDNEF